MGFLDDLESGVNNAWNSISSTGAPAVIAGAEQYAAQLLQKESVKNQAAAQAAVNKAVASGSQATGVLKNIQDMFGTLGQGAVFKQYGLLIVGGLVVVLIIGRKVL